MSKRTFRGKLEGNRHSSSCVVTTGPNGDAYISDVTPPLPDGDYELSVNGLVLKVRFAKGVWQQIAT